MIGGSALQVEVDDPETATAGELRAKVLEMEGLEPALGEQIFAIWLVDSRLSEGIWVQNIPSTWKNFAIKI